MLDIIGNLIFLMPLCIVMIAEGLPFFASSWRIGEGSLTPGGIPQWPAKALIPAAFALLLLQALSEIVKSISFLRGIEPAPAASGATSAEEARALRSSGAP